MAETRDQALSLQREELDRAAKETAGQARSAERANSANAALTRDVDAQRIHIEELERSLKAERAELKGKKGELHKLSQITSLIHKISSGDVEAKDGAPLL